jgi:hypothetical protein
MPGVQSPCRYEPAWVHVGAGKLDVVDVLASGGTGSMSERRQEGPNAAWHGAMAARRFDGCGVRRLQAGAHDLGKVAPGLRFPTAPRRLALGCRLPIFGAAGVRATLIFFFFFCTGVDQERRRAVLGRPGARCWCCYRAAAPARLATNGGARRAGGGRGAAAGQRGARPSTSPFSPAAHISRGARTVASSTHHGFSLCAHVQAQRGSGSGALR